MCCKQRAISWKDQTAFIWVLYLQRDYKQDPPQTLQTEHVLLKNSEVFFPFYRFRKMFFFFVSPP